MTGDNDTITLADAAQHFGFGVATLRAEAERGRLTLYKIGGRYFTTRGSVEALDRAWHGRKNVAHEGSGIYVIGFDQYIKIGWSESLADRLRHLQLALPVKIKVYASFSCAKVNERILHRRFRKYRTRGEWFRIEGDVAEWLKRGCSL
jgi:hypothetical protein